MTSKRVTVAITLDAQFVRLLSANVELQMPGCISGNYHKQMTPSQVLALVVLLEARGAPEEQVHAATPPEWRPNIEAVHALRKVEVV